LAFQGLLTRRADYADLSRAVQRAWAAAMKPDPSAVAARPQLPAAAGVVQSAQAQENQAAAQHAIGLVLLDLGQLDAAAEHLEQALAVRQRLVQGEPASLAAFTDLAATLMGLARLNQKAGRLERARQSRAQAVPLLTRAVAQRPDDRRAWKDLGLARAELGQPEAAATAFAQLLERTPESQRAQTLMGLAELDRKAGRPDRARGWWAQAVPLLTRADAQRPHDRQAWRDLGVTRAELGQPDAAATAFAQLLERTPESKEPGYWWSEDPAGIGEALAPYDEIFARVVQMRPRDRNLLIARFHYFGRRRRWREAAEMAARIHELDPEDGWPLFYIRHLLFHLGDLEGYRRESRHRLVYFNDKMMIERTPEGSTTTSAHPTGPISLASGTYQEGRYTETIRRSEEIVERSSHPLELTMAHLHLAMAHQRLGHPTEARRELDAARKWLEGLGRVYGDSDASEGELMDYGWTEWVIATSLRNEAEGLIVYDPIFPADPFAR
jgi:tetratricopeptide (TPR) repeat protein